MDYGASGGRGIVGEFDGNAIRLSEVHRFTNEPVVAGDTMYWDFLRLFHGLKLTLSACNREGGVDSLAVDTWGVDFGLLDEYGDLIGNPVHYRDRRTVGMLPACAERMSPERVYAITGIQEMEINTLVQLLVLRERMGGTLERAKDLLMMPDLFGYFLSGVKVSEYSIASTTQMLDAKNKKWSEEVLTAFNIPGRILSDVVPSGTVLGDIRSGIVDELGLAFRPKIIAACGHDTQDAMFAAPAKEDDFVFISCGTWAVFGTELDMPVLDGKAMGYNLSNEGGYGGKASFLKNITGTWLIQESRRQWRREGKDFEYSDLEQLAAKEKPFVSFIDPDAPEFGFAGNMPERIREYCKRTNQPVPETEGAVVRCINESLALTYRATMEEISDCTGKTYDKIYLVGGGSQSKLLCAMTANATSKVLSAGPVEATVFGNVAIQLMASGEFKDVKEAREVISRSPDISTYEPKDTALWEEAYQRFKDITGK